MEAIVDQPLRHVVDLDARRFEAAQVEDALVGDEAARAPVEHRVVRFEAVGDVVRVQDRGLGGPAKAGGAHQPDVGPGDREDRRAADRRRADRADVAAALGPRAVRATGGGKGVARQERREVAGDGDRSHSGAAAAMRDAERLVQVQVADVGTVVAGPADADLCVHVRAVEVDLPAVVVDDGADLADRLLEHAVGRRVGDHQGGEVVAVGIRLCLQVFEVDVPLVVALDRRNLQAGKDRTRGVRAVRRGGDQADVARALAAALVVAADRQQARILALGTGVRLQGDGGEARDVRQPVLQVDAELPVSGGLLGRCVGVHVGEAAPGDRHHLRRSVQLHRAGAERDHRRGQGQVARLQPVEVAEEFGLRPVAAEHGMFEAG